VAGPSAAGPIPPWRRDLQRLGPILGGLLAAVLAGIGCAAATPQPATSTEHRAAEILSRAIRFRTVNPPGDEAPLAAYFTGLLQGSGVEARLVATPGADSGAGRAAAWARLPGSAGRPPVVLLSHLDVVPADPAAWRVDPFAGVREGGYVVGRGAQDAKGVAVLHLLALLELARRHERLERDVIFLATPDEETGGIDGAGWLARERRDLLGGARYLLTEGGGVLTRPGSPAAWHVAVTEKTPCWLRITARGRPGHSSVPARDAAVPKLLAALEPIRSLQPEVRVVPAVARMFAALAPVAPADDAAGFADLAFALESDAGFRERFLGQPNYAALVRDTLNITVLEGAAGTNVLPARAAAHLDARLLPGARCDGFAARIRSRVAAPGVSVEELLSFASGSSPRATPLYDSIEAVARATEPGAVVIPRVVAGFTDAHWFREIGLVAYGFVPRWHRVGEPRGVHGPNERISVENLERGVTTLIAILEELDRREDGSTTEADQSSASSWTTRWSVSKSVSTSSTSRQEKAMRRSLGEVAIRPTP
jgi:acetylornithine deacetylase/succinyl-diaminopimelate desuccinylase-like protein